MNPVVPLGAHGVRAWRWVAAMALVATAVATHWPRLTFGPEGPSDKWVHAIAFGVLTWFVWEARWIRRVITLGVVACAYAAIDESTQQLAIFQRHTSIEDYGADVCGIAVACALLWPPFAPISTAARMRRALRLAARARMWDRPTTWLAIATTAVACALVGGVVSLGYWYWVGHHIALGQCILLGMCTSVILGVASAVTLGGCASTRIIRRNRCCFHCGAPVNEVQGEPSPAGACSHCATPWRAVQWSVPADTDESGRRSTRRPPSSGRTRSAIFASILIPVVVMLLWVTWRIPPVDPLGDSGEREYFLLRALTIMIIASIAASRLLNRADLRRYEREGIDCLACGHSVEGTRADGGIGRCPECGGEFIRVSDPA